MRILSVDREEKIEVLRENPYFRGLDDFILQELAEDTVLREYQRGEVLFWQDEPSAGLYIIRRGSVKLFKVSPKGREHIINVFEEGTSFNEVPVFDHSMNPVNVAALEDCQIWIVGASTIRRLSLEYPKMAQAVILNLCANLRMLVEKLEELSFCQVTNRLARLIIELPTEQLSGPLDQRITQDQLAARLGTVREVVARSLKDLERSGAIRVDRRCIQVMDEKVLMEWGQAPD
jgi:CRP/FNR family transcriptional regulator